MTFNTVMVPVAIFSNYQKAKRMSKVLLKVQLSDETLLVRHHPIPLHLIPPHLSNEVTLEEHKIKNTIANTNTNTTSTTNYKPVPLDTDPVPPSTNQYLLLLTHYHYSSNANVSISFVDLI